MQFNSERFVEMLEVLKKEGFVKEYICSISGSWAQVEIAGEEYYSVRFAVIEDDKFNNIKKKRDRELGRI